MPLNPLRPNVTLRRYTTHCFYRDSRPGARRFEEGIVGLLAVVAEPEVILVLHCSTLPMMITEYTSPPYTLFEGDFTIPARFTWPVCAFYLDFALMNGLNVAQFRFHFLATSRVALQWKGTDEF